MRKLLFQPASYISYLITALYICPEAGFAVVAKPVTLLENPSPLKLSYGNSSSQFLSLKRKKHKKWQCSDRKDNDHDGFKDYPADPGCKNKRDNREKNKKWLLLPTH